MERHVHLAGVLNIVYRSMTILEALVFFVLSLGFRHLVGFLVRSDSIAPDEIPMEILDIVPAILLFVAAIVLVVSILGIVGAAGVLKKKEWARIVLLVVSFFNLLRVPVGTVLGIYSIWVLMNSRTIPLFNPSSVRRATRSKA